MATTAWHFLSDLCFGEMRRKKGGRVHCSSFFPHIRVLSRCFALSVLLYEWVRGCARRLEPTGLFVVVHGTFIIYPEFSTLNILPCTGLSEEQEHLVRAFSQFWVKYIKWFEGRWVVFIVPNKIGMCSNTSYWVCWHFVGIMFLLGKQATDDFTIQIYRQNFFLYRCWV